MLDREGKVVPGQKGYRYFGAAKDLPGVRELFEAETVVAEKRMRSQLMKKVDAEYYGYMDDDDGTLEPLEQIAERAALQRIVTEYNEALADGSLERDPSEDEDLYLSEKDPDVVISNSKEDESGENVSRFVAHVPVPSQKQVEAYLLQRKKEELLQRYAKA